MPGQRRESCALLCSQSAFPLLGGAEVRLSRPQWDQDPESHRRADPHKAGNRQSGIERRGHMGNIEQKETLPRQAGRPSFPSKTDKRGIGGPIPKKDRISALWDSFTVVLAAADGSDYEVLYSFRRALANRGAIIVSLWSPGKYRNTAGGWRRHQYGANASAQRGASRSIDASAKEDRRLNLTRRDDVEFCAGATPDFEDRR